MKTIEVTYSAPLAGLNQQSPANLLDPSFSPVLSNVILRNAEIRSRPTLAFTLPAPDPKDPPIGQGSFMDANGTLHTFAFTSRGLWQLNGNNTSVTPNPWVALGGDPLIPLLPVSWRVFVNELFYTNGNIVMDTWDGIQPSPSQASTITSPSVGGPGTIGGQYVSELDDHLVLVNITGFNATTGSVVRLPQRVWWSANGLPLIWDPTVNTSAGFTDLLDVPDIITGFVTVGNVGYIYRSNGITTMVPTGRGIDPFKFEHLWSSERGIGNIYPFAFAQYGSICIFISWDNLYMMSVNSVQPIGGGARDNILTDLSNATLNPTGAIIPNYTRSYTYLTYILSIPLGTFTRLYVYSLEDKNWTRFDVTGQVALSNASRIWR